MEGVLNFSQDNPFEQAVDGIKIPIFVVAIFSAFIN